MSIREKMLPMLEQAKMLTDDEARRIASKIAKLPGLLGSIRQSASQQGGIKCVIR
jgi:hypothetical protein